MTSIKLINTKNAPQPAGHYSQATVYNGTVYVAGTLGIFLERPDYIGTIEEQTEQILKHIREILLAAQSDLDHLLSVTIFITNPNDWAQVNTVYTKMLDTHKPARAVITAAALPKGFHIEMLATAAVKLTA